MDNILIGVFVPFGIIFVGALSYYRWMIKKRSLDGPKVGVCAESVSGGMFREGAPWRLGVQNTATRDL